LQTICVVVPCYNESGRLPVGEFLSFLEGNPHVAFCFVNDGSWDTTSDALAELRCRGPDEQVQVVSLERNRGKAEAVRAGVLHALMWREFDYVGYLDADLATPLSELNHLLTYEPRPGRFAVICGSRVRRLGARIERSAVRHVLGRVFATFASMVLQLPVYDTQCGAKLIRSDLAAQILDRPFVCRWLFDVEILARTVRLLGRAQANEQLLEVPLRAWKERGKSRLRMRDFLTAPVNLLKIYTKYRGN
jgi:dolichyl-phosphate beta-glucosyltransferase